jgi:hypothetical protein
MKANNKLWNTNKATRKFMVMNYEIKESMTGKAIDFTNGKSKFGVQKNVSNRILKIVDIEKNTLNLNKKAYKTLKEIGVELEQLVF